MASVVDFRVKNGLVVATTATIQSSAQATSTTTGALQVTGGAGIGRDLWVGGTIYGNIAGTATTSTQVNTVQQVTSATYYPTFVDANNATSTGELVYTTSSFVINPSTGNVGIGTTAPAAKLALAIDRDVSDPVLSVRRNNNAGGGLGNPETGIDVSIPFTFNNASTTTGIKVYVRHNLAGEHYGGHFETYGGAYSTGVAVYAKTTHRDTNGPGYQPAVFADAYSIIGPTNSGYAVGLRARTNDYVNNVNIVAESLYTGTLTQTILAINRNSVDVGSIRTSPTAVSYYTSNSSGLIGIDATTVGINTNNAERVRINSTGLAINTSTVRSAFDVEGTARISGITTVTNATASISSTTGALQVAGGVGIGGNLYVGGATASFATNVGIGATNPTTPLEVVGSQGADGIKVYSSSTGQAPSSLAFALGGSSNSTIVLRVDPRSSTGSRAGLTISNPNQSLTFMTFGGTDANGLTFGGIISPTSEGQLVVPTAYSYFLKGVVAGADNGAGTAPADGYFRSGQKNNSITDVTGSNVYLQAGAGTGAATGGGNIFLQTPDVGASSTVTQSYTTKLSINRQGQVNVTTNTNATSTTSGALIVAGGVGVGRDLWVGGTIYGTFSGAVSGTATTSTQINTVQQVTSATYYPTFVDANNATSIAELLYTTSSLLVNPGLGVVGIGAISTTATLSVSDTSLASTGSLFGSLLNLSQTWNTSGTPTAIKLNITDTASGANSLLMDLQTGQSSKFQVKKSGEIGIGDGKITSLTSQFTFRNNNQNTFLIGTSGAILASTHLFGWSGTADAGTGADLLLYRDAANILAQRNSTNAQTFRLYRTYTDGSNHAYTAAKQDATAGYILDSVNTGTASTATNLLDLQTNGVSRFTVGRDGFISNGGIGISGSTVRLLAGNGNSLYINRAGTTNYSELVTFYDASGTNAYININADAQYRIGGDTILARDAANALAQRNGTNAQTFRVYNTFTDASNYERGFMRWNANVLEIGTEAGGSGVTRPMSLLASRQLRLQSAGGWDVQIIPNGVFGFAFTLNGVMQFGGSTTAFPALKRNGTTLQVRLADDSGDADFSARTITASGGVTISGITTVTNTTNATSTITGALQVAGGAGIGGNLYVGGEIVAQKLTIQLTTVTTTLIETDDVIKTTNSTNATSTITGALQIAGGAGIGRDLWVGGTIYGTFNGAVSGTATTATQINTVRQSTSATYYPIFVDSNNATSTGELVYTTSSFVINPATGNISVGTESTPYKFSIVNSSNTSGFYLESSSPTIGDTHIAAKILAASGSVNQSTTGLAIGTSGSNGGEATYTGLSVSGNTRNTAIGVDSTVTKNWGGAALFGSAIGVRGSGSTDSSLGTAYGGYFIGASNSGTTYGLYVDVTGSGTRIPFAVAISGSEALRVNSAGNLGIATASPESKLHVSGDARITGITTVTNTTNATSTITGALQVAGGAGIGRDLWVGGTAYGSFNGTLTGTATTATQLNTVQQTANATYYPTFVDSNNATSAGELVYTTSSFVINPSTGLMTLTGNLTVNSANGSPSLYLTNSSTNSPYLQFQSGGLIQDLGSGSVRIRGGSTTGNIVFDTSSTQRMTILPDGNVGIGTAAPTNKLSVNGSVGILGANSLSFPDVSGSPSLSGTSLNIGFQTFTLTGAVSYANIVSDRQITITKSGHGSDAGQRVALLIKPSTDPTSSIYTPFEIQNVSSSTLFTVNKTGNVGIGITTATTKLDVAGGVRVSGVTTVTNTTNATSTTTGALQVAGGVGIGGNLNAGGSAFKFGSFENGINTPISLDLTHLNNTTGATLRLYDVNSARYVSLNHNNSTRATLAVATDANASGWGSSAFILNIGSYTDINGVTGRDLFDLRSGNSTKFYIDANGKTGIATTSTVAALNVGGGAIITGVSTVTNTTNSVSTTTGALQVVGGAGIGRDLWVGGNIYGTFNGTVSGTATTATQLNTVQQTTTATYYPTFVDSNNATSGAELLYTTSSLLVNPGLGVVGIGAISTTATLSVSDTGLASTGSLAGSLLNLSQTWNTSGSPTAIKLSVIDTASSSTSNLLEFQGGTSGTTSLFRVKKDGGAVATSYILEQSGIGNVGGLQIVTTRPALVFAGVTYARWTSGFFIAGQPVAFSDNGTTTDTILRRDDANILALRNGANAQTFRVYNTFTDATNYERAKIGWNANTLEIGTENSGTGVARDINFLHSGTARAKITNNGIVSPSNLGGGISISGIGWQNGNGSYYETLSYISSPSRIYIQNASMFGWGTTSAFPALKRNGTTLQVRLADDSGDADFSARTITASGAVTVSGITTVTNITNATSTITGALQVAGGVGVGGNLYVGGEIVAQRLTIQLTTVTTTLIQTDDIINTYNTTNATSTITGALQVAGGAGIGRDLWIGGTAYGSFNGNLTGVATTATTATQVNVVQQTSTLTHYLAFVDSNNATAGGEALYTTSSFIINPATGNVAIGTTSTTYKLEVNGTFAAVTKSFRIDHPTKPGKKLQYGSLESPYHGIRLTGRDTVVKGSCTVHLPDYVSALVKEDGINIQLTNYKHNKTLYVDDIDLENNCFTVKGAKLGQLEFFWTFSAIRKDIDDLDVEV